MKNNFMVVTTDTIEGMPIQKCIGVICANTVVGTNIFSDIAASFSDFFGGRSGSYKKKLDRLYEDVIKELKRKAKDLGANGIVGLKIDFDEISGKDKSMFMVSASGTACVLEKSKESKGTDSDHLVISQDAIYKEIYRRDVVKNVNDGKEIKIQWMEFLLDNPQIDILDNLLDRYTTYINSSEAYEDNIKFVESFIPLLDKDIVIDKVYKKYDSDKIGMKYLISNCFLFSPNKILDMCNTNLHGALDLLLCYSSSYTDKDLNIMHKIYEKLTNLPDTGKIELAKGGLLGKEKERFICQNGHKSSSDSEYCNSCNINIKGLNRDEVNSIEVFKERINALESLLNDINFN